MSQNSVSILAVTLTAITKLHPIDTSTSAGMLLTSPPSISAWPLRTIGTESTGRLMLSRIAWTASPRSRTTDLPPTRSTVTERHGTASCSSLQSWRYLRSIGSKCPRRYLYSRYQWLPRGSWRKIHEGRRSVGELVCAVVGVQAGGVENAGHGAGAGAGDHVHDDAVLFEGLEHAEVGHAASGPAAEGHADAHAAEVVDQSLQAAGQRPAPGQLRGRLGDLEIAAGEDVNINDQVMLCPRLCHDEMDQRRSRPVPHCFA